MTNLEQETEFARRRNFPSVEVKRMFAGPKARIMDVILYCRDRGKEIGWMTEITKGKKRTRSFVLPTL